jgi:bifunctional DNA-binding transcriptional regulator/antitoxin component of YhaV-PrlF toxin-antitoxin module
VEVAIVTSYVMRVSANGQVSIPAEARARWQAERVTVVDLGDRIVMRPLPEDPIGELRGRYRGRGPDTEAARAESRRDDERRRRR